MGSCQRAEHTCTKYHPLLKGGTVVRHCDSAGKSSVPDFSRCCVQKSGSGPFALVWLTYTGVSSSFYLSSVEIIKRSVSVCVCACVHACVHACVCVTSSNFVSTNFIYVHVCMFITFYIPTYILCVLMFFSIISTLIHRPYNNNIIMLQYIYTYIYM